MGRGSEFFWFLNMAQYPTMSQARNLFSYLALTEELKELRAEYLERLKSLENDAMPKPKNTVKV